LNLSKKAADFDHIADTYDTSFTHSEVGKRQRAQVWHYLDKQLSENQKLNILELNCGTGEDAIFLAQKGHQLTATDISKEMTKVAQQKVKIIGLSNQIQIQTLAVQEVTQQQFSQSFDCMFSNFGGLNCLSPIDLQTLAQDVPNLLSSKGRFIAVVMPTFCIWESLYFLLKNDKNQAFRRNTNEAVLANVEDRQVPTWYYSPQHFEQLFAPQFTLKKVVPIGIALPPSYLETFFKKHLYLLKTLNLLEKTFSKISFLAAFSDHYLIDLEKKV